MKIGIFTPKKMPISVKVYINNLVPFMEQQGVTTYRFNETEPLREPVDLYWDPRAGRPGPHPAVQSEKIPYVVTFHGAAHLTQPLENVYIPVWKGWTWGIYRRVLSRYQWTAGIKKSPAAIISVCKYAAWELEHVFGHKSIPIYSGVDHNLFYPDGKPSDDYLLHVSSFHPKKNVKRVIAAYRQVNIPNKPVLRIILPNYKGEPLVTETDNINLTHDYVPHSELVNYYRNAMGMIYPSLHECFGTPISEAMASGCPVITSNTTGCAEIAADAALTVDPYSVDAIAQAMKKLIEDKPLRNSLREKGIKRAAEFSWEKSAAEHLAVFELALNKSAPV